MKAYKWVLCILLVIVMSAGVVFFGNFRSDDASPNRSAQPTVFETQDALPETVTEFTFSDQAYSADLLQFLNAYRQRSDLPQWTVNDALAAAAKTRAHECALLQSKTHTRTDGSEWYTVLEIEENYNYTEITGISTQSVADLANSWIASESINAGLLSADYTECGVGCEAVGSEVYVVLILYMP